MSRELRIVLALALAAVLLPAVLTACPLCKDGKSDTDYPGGAASLPRGFYYSILLMVSAPFAVAGGLVLKIRHARRRARAARAPGEAAPAGADPGPGAPLLPHTPGARP